VARPVPSALLIGETLGQRYKLVRLLGRGGMGSVYEAEQGDTRLRVAVKVLHSDLLEPGGEGLRRFHREADAARAIGGAHVARVIDAGSDEATGHAYLVTEYLEGEDLQQLLDRVGPLVPEAALRIARQVLVGLCDAHAAGVVHRDIKPANLFLTRGEGGVISVKLLDFGIAKMRVESLGLSHTAGLTTTGGILGSPLYMSPEQVQSSKDVDHRTDLWSLGSVLYAALAGRAPHQHLVSLGQLLVAVCVTPAPRLSEIAPWVSPEIAEVVHRAIEIRADARYGSAAVMLEAIAQLVPEGALCEEMLASSGERPRAVMASSMPPSPAAVSPRFVVAPDFEPRLHGGDAGTAPGAREAAFTGSTTLPSAERPGAARSAVPEVGPQAGGRYVTVDPRRLLGDKCELWTFSLEVHRSVSSLVARVWRSLRRAGADVPAMTYGTAWVLIEARTGRAIGEGGVGLEKVSLEDAGLRPGSVLWAVAPAVVARQRVGTEEPPA
jgi:serine/threonine protein kinase